MKIIAACALFILLVFSTASAFPPSAPINLPPQYGQWITIETTVSLASAATSFTIYTVPANSTFMPHTVTARMDNDAAATTGNYWGVGVDASNRRVDYGVCATAAASSLHLANAKLRWVNAPGLTNTPQIAAAGDVIKLISGTLATDASLLGSNMGGAAGDAVKVIIRGLLVTDIPNY